MEEVAVVRWVVVVVRIQHKERLPMPHVSAGPFLVPFPVEVVVRPAVVVDVVRAVVLLPGVVDLVVVLLSEVVGALVVVP